MTTTTMATTPAPWSESPWDAPSKSCACRCEVCDRVFVSEQALRDHEHLIAAHDFGHVDEKQIVVALKPCPGSRKGLVAASAMARFNPPPGPRSKKLSAVFSMMEVMARERPELLGRVAKASSVSRRSRSGRVRKPTNKKARNDEM